MKTKTTKSLPTNIYCLGYAFVHETKCPATPFQAYRLGHNHRAFWLARSCETA